MVTPTVGPPSPRIFGLEYQCEFSRHRGDILSTCIERKPALRNVKVEQGAFSADAGSEKSGSRIRVLEQNASEGKLALAYRKVQLDRQLSPPDGERNNHAA